MSPQEIAVILKALKAYTTSNFIMTDSYYTSEEEREVIESLRERFKGIRYLRHQVAVLEKMITKVKEQKADPKNYDLEDELSCELQLHIDRKKDIEEMIDRLCGLLDNCTVTHPM